MNKKKPPVEVVAPKEPAQPVGPPYEVKCLEGGDVDLFVNGQRVILDDGIILRWGRKRDSHE